MRRLCAGAIAAVILCLGALAPLAAQQNIAGGRIALVIGNSKYEGSAALRNPANDAMDIGATLTSLGFQAEILTDADLYTMEDAILRFRDRLKVVPDSVGFFYYAGHGIQSNGENYLIPLDARLNSESMLRNRAVPLQFVLDSLSEARNKLNIIVLDACRDNPFSWARSSSSRGLAVVGQLPPASIVVYSTSAGKVAQDGTGRNGLFTEELLRHLPTPGLDITEVLRRTGEGVQAKTGGAQIPAIYSQFFGFLKLAGEGAALAGVPASMQSGAGMAQPGADDVDLDWLPAFFDEASPASQRRIAKAEALVWDGKWLSAWRLLDEADPDNRDPYILAQKIRVALDGSSSTDNYLGFTFYDTPPDIDVEQARANGRLEEPHFDFDPRRAVQALERRRVEIPPVLALALGDYYYNVYNYAVGSFVLPQEEVLQEGLRWFDMANESYIVVDTTSVRHYAELLLNAGRSMDAVAILRDQVEWEPDDAALRQFYAEALSAALMIDDALSQYDILISQAGSNDEAQEYYQKAADLAFQNGKKGPLERYLSAMEQLYPADSFALVLRHRIAVTTQDHTRAKAIGEDLLRRFPVAEDATTLENILGNWLGEPGKASIEAGLSFLDSAIARAKGKPRDLGLLYFYRALYRYFTVENESASKAKDATIKRCFEDLDAAEKNLRQAGEPESGLLQSIRDIREKWTKNR